MITLFATLTREEAEAVLDGRVPLAQIHPIDSITGEAEETVCLSDQMNPSMPEQCIIEIDLAVTDAALAGFTVPIVDRSDVNYDVPRLWLNEARCRLVTDAEILAFCIETIDDPMVPGITPYRVAIGEAVESGETEDISPHYLKAFHAAADSTVGEFPDRRCLHRYEGGTVYVAERENRFYVILDESAMADLLDEEDADGLDHVNVLEFDNDADREAYLVRRFRHPSSG